MAEEKDVKVKIAFEPGPVIRIIGQYEWSEAAGWVRAVPLDLAADLLAYPHLGWSLAEKLTAPVRKALAEKLGVAPENIADPGGPGRQPKKLADIAGPERAAQLVELGVADVKALAGLKADDVAGLVFRSGATAAEFEEWQSRAVEEVALW